MSELDCGDNSCAFAKEKGGMRTNGGCRCFSNAGFQRSAVASAHEMLPELIESRALLARYKSALEKIYKDAGELEMRYVRGEPNDYTAAVSHFWMIADEALGKEKANGEG